ncbi:hypothetical protein K435DRAFT_862612 [Dendrothele bispora CBS 962.96]|uniref:Uncharacterized protein n=1 Tax=Dendrothele bispora (strain CBS 962.96) TaxID=1314807 RepID=A0A4S8LSK2_DENBC|nr:hypothetical protein K435DRAFT_862612 [Dendrothele bispora CBS 962.96]
MYNNSNRNSQSTQPLLTAHWRRILTLGSSGPWTKGAVCRNPREEEHKQVTDIMQSLFAQTRPGLSPFPSSTLLLTPVNQAKQLMRELSLLNFRHQLLQVDELVDESRPRASPTTTKAQLQVALANHTRSRLMLVDRVLGGSGDLSTITFVDLGIAADKWLDRVEPLPSFWKLMDSWSGTKDSIWNRGADSNISKMPSVGEEWERVLVHFYVQTHFNVIGYAPVLPRKI